MTHSSEAPNEPMALIKYNFETWAGRIGPGEIEVETVSDAIGMCAKLNEIWGEGTHCVETLNHTLAERRGSALTGKGDGQ